MGPISLLFAPGVIMQNMKKEGYGQVGWEAGDMQA